MIAAPQTLTSLVVIAKNPLPGKVKTRLIGSFDVEQAALLAAAALADTLAVLTEVPCRERVLLFDGDSSAWLPEGWRLLVQEPGGLDVRLVAGFEQLSGGPALLVGMDTPQLRPDQLGFDYDNHDACLGMAADGGYWALGLRDPRQARSVILGVPMSTGLTGAVQHQRLLASGMKVQRLDVLVDVDTESSAHAVATGHPETGFARVWREMCRQGAAVPE